MCTNKREITISKGRSMFVDCGHCPACKQAKANARARRILANTEDFSKVDRIFITLTYKNDHIPYVWEDDLNRFLSNQITAIPIYRDKSSRLFYNRHDSTYKVLESSLFMPIDYIYRDDFSDFGFDRFASFDSEYKYIRTSLDRFNSFENGKISVCYYPDLQCFLKRLRIRLQRDNYVKKFSYYGCSEYGPTTHRAHFHLCLQVEKGDFAYFKSAVASSWLFDDMERRLDNIELAYKPAAYLASYVNSDNSISGLLHYCNKVKPKHSYSQGYGVAKTEFSFPQVSKKILDGNLTYIETISRNGCLAPTPLLVPKYVVGRYFPKWKGFNELTTNEVYRIVESPERIYWYKDVCQLTNSEAKQIFIKLSNLNKKFGSDIYPYLYSKAWTVFQCSLLRLFHDSDYKSDPLESYDNIMQFYVGDFDNDFVSLDNREFYETDPNKFLLNRERTQYLLNRYHERSKDKKVKNLAYSKCQNV